MVTETVVLDRADDTWRSIVNTGNFIVLVGMTGPIRVRFGITSTSEGILLEPGSSLQAAETVYVQPTKQGLRNSQYITLYVNKG